jgi:type II secretory pathway pseudopilin PulG
VAALRSSVRPTACPLLSLQPSRACQQSSPRRGAYASPGVTIVEVLVTITFLSVVAAGIAGLAVGVIKGNSQAKSMDTAVFLAHDRLERIRNTPYAGVTAAAFPAEGYGAISVGNPAVPFPNFQRVVAIQDNTPTAGMKRVIVTVSWRGGSISEEMLVAQ